MNVQTGKRVGTVDKSNGYRRLCVDRQMLYEHRLAWFYMTGSWPDDEMDHKDLDRANNAWSNLREANRLQNLGNRAVNRNNALKTKGVSLCKATKRYKAQITVNRKNINLGRYATIAEASQVYEAAAREHFGEFARAA